MTHKIQIAEMGAYVKLLEYDNIDGMILLSELSRRRIRSIQKLIRVGRNEVVVVLRVDKEKGGAATIICGGNGADEARIHRSLKTKSLTRRYHQMRREVQQGKDGCINYASCCREDEDANGDSLSRDWLAFEQEIWSCC